MKKDLAILRELVKEYAEKAALPRQDEKRRMWAASNSLRMERPPVIATFGMWNVWCREVFADSKMKCEDPFFREWERTLKMLLLGQEKGDDTIAEPWLAVRAVRDGDPWGALWGVKIEYHDSHVDGGAWKFDPVLKTWDDVKKLKPPVFKINREKTAEAFNRLNDAAGDIIKVAADYGPVCSGFMSDISNHLVRMRGLEQIMIDMYESPDELHHLLAFMRDGILANQEAAEKAGEYTLLNHTNQELSYCDELKPPSPSGESVQRKNLWFFSASQEYTLVSPDMFYEFMLQYQIPIIEKFGLSAYGCCENLTDKIGQLRKVPNLRKIAVTPTADVAKCAEEIKNDYQISWRPNPTDMVCYGFDEAKIRRIIGDGARALKGCSYSVHLKDIETVEGDVSRLAKWVRIVKDEIEKNS